MSEDQKWRQTTEHQIVTLLTSQQVSDRRLDDIETILNDLDQILRGDPRGQLDGIISQLHQIQTDLSRLNAVIFQDSTGKRGLIHDVEILKGGREDLRDRRGQWTKIAVALITSGGLWIFWPGIKAFLQKRSTIDTTIESARPSVHRHYRIEVPPEAED